MGRLEYTLPLSLLTPSPQSFMIVVQKYNIFSYLPMELRFLLTTDF
jgi:hypothetical protein